VALYFIQPTGHGLKPLDVKTMSLLGENTNLVPVIAKSDTLTLEERKAFKDRVQEELRFNGIKVYPAASDLDYDAAERARNAEILKFIPFEIVGSEKSITVNNKPVRGRRHAWGLINIENPEHCEFVNLREFLMKTHLHDLVDTTRLMHYETFRSGQLAAKKKKAEAKKDGKKPKA